MAIEIGLTSGTWAGEISAMVAMVPQPKIIRLSVGDINATLASMQDRIDDFWNRSLKVSPMLVEFYARMPTDAECDGLGSRAAGVMSGSAFANAHPGFAIDYIEFGNETSYSYQGTQGQGGTYAQKLKRAAQAVQTATGGKVQLLGQADDGNTGSGWVDAMFTAVPDINNWVAGWVVHPYGPQPSSKMTTAVTRLEAHSVDLTQKGIWITEFGVASDDGRSLSDNYGFPLNLTYSQAATTMTTATNDLLNRYPNKIRAFTLYASRDQGVHGSDTSNDRELWFGANIRGANDAWSRKGAYTTAVEAFIAKSTGTVEPPLPTTAVYVTNFRAVGQTLAWDATTGATGYTVAAIHSPYDAAALREYYTLGAVTTYDPPDVANEIIHYDISPIGPVGADWLSSKAGGDANRVAISYTGTAPSPVDTTAIITYASTFSLTGAARTSATVPLAGPSVGRVALMAVNVESPVTLSIPGWNLITTVDNTTMRDSVWWRRISGTSDDPVITWGGTSVYMSVAGAIYGNVTTATNPIDNAGTAWSARANADKPMAANSVTTTSSKAALVFIGFNRFALDIAPPAGFIERSDLSTTEVYIADLLNDDPPGASGVITATMPTTVDPEPNTNFLIALAPQSTAPTTAPGYDTLVDEFNTGTVPDATKWPFILGNSTVSGGNAVFTPSTTALIAEVKTNAIYDGRGKSITVGPVTPSLISSGTGSKKGAYLSIGPSTGAAWAGMAEFDGNLVCNIVLNDGSDPGVTSVAYSNTTMRYWRASIAADGATITLATSPDGVTWTTRRSGLAQWAITPTTPGWASIGAKIESGTPVLTPATFGMVNGTIATTVVQRTMWGGYKQLTGASGVAQGPWTVVAGDITVPPSGSRTLVIQINSGANVTQPSPAPAGAPIGLVGGAGDGRILVGVDQPADARVVAIEYEISTNGTTWTLGKRI